MSFPTTPQKRDDGINQIVRALNVKWGLDIAIKDSLWSPSKVSNTDAKEERIFQLIRFLYFKHHASMQDALRKFELHASRYTASKWVFKPQADQDTLPSRASSHSPIRSGSPIEQTHKSESETDAMKDTLLRLLVEARDHPVEYILHDTSTHQISSCHGEQRIPEEAKLQRFDQLGVPSLEPSFREELSQERQSLTEDPFVDDFPLDQEFAASLSEHIMVNLSNQRELIPQMVNRGCQPISSSSKETSNDDVFTTPPTSPCQRLGLFPTPDSSMTKPAKEHDRDDLVFFQEPDLVKIPQITPLPLQTSSLEQAVLTDTRRVSRKIDDQQSPRLFGVHHMVPIISVNSSFDSLTSPSQSSLTASTAPTPPTSSYIESATTSFGSIDDPNTSSCIRLIEEVNERSKPKGVPPISDDFMEPDLDTSDYEFDPILQWPITPSNHSSAVSKTRNYASELPQLMLQERPFIPLMLSEHMPQSFRLVYEISRVALHCEMSLKDLSRNPRRENGEHGEFWSSLEWACRKQGKSPPYPSAFDVWKKTEKTFQGVALSGELSFSGKKRGPIFDLNLNPLKLEKAHRFSLKFGGDRFLVLGLPRLEPNNLPSYLRNDAAAARAAIISWIVDSDHILLGRTWRAFYVKPKEKSKKRKSEKDASNAIGYRIYFFAINGHDFISRESAVKHHNGQKTPHISMTVAEMLDWFIPAISNMEQPALKLFARIDLGVSPIQPTVEFKPHQIIRTRDAFAGSPAERCLSVDRHRKEGTAEMLQDRESSSAALMNDGCARISRKAAAAITQSLNINSYTPCAFQGRIGGAKGVWFVDAIGERLSEPDNDFWIEVTDSQLKVEGHAAEAIDPDPIWLTFCSVGHSMPLSSKTLSFQLITILVDRGVPDIVIMKMLEADITDKVDELRDAMDNGLKLRKWNQEKNPVTEERIQRRAIKMQGALPESLSEKINWFVEHGFEPQACNYLNHLCSRTITPHCADLADRGNISVGRSASALMIADPLGVLEENQVHLGFSNKFTDSKSGFQDTLLNNMDILVARTPAHLPSDIQKVRAIFKPELSLYKDVIIFPSKGSCSLADKLSGGDYDGDKAWICWEPELVAPFVNADKHPPQDLAFYGITKDRTKVSDVISESNFHSSFLQKGFEFSIEEDLTGKCTNYHKAFCYKQQSIDSLVAKDIAILLGHLVDSAKGGLVFTNQTWTEFLQRNGLPKFLHKPAYKDRHNGSFTDHIIDKLVLLAKQVSDNALESLSKYLKGKAADYDYDLVMLWKDVDEEAKTDSELKEILTDLQTKLRVVRDNRSINTHVRDADGKNSLNGNYATAAERAREEFLDIRPLEGSRHPLARHWKRQIERHETDRSKGQDEWGLLKASALFFQSPTGGYPWYAAGAELGQLKLQSRNSRNIVEDLYVAMKLDGKFLRERKVEEEEGESGNEWDELDEDVWDDSELECFLD